MFFDDPSKIPAIASRTGCAIFAVSPDTQLDLPFALYLKPDQTKTKTPVITIDALKDFLKLTQNRETTERFFVISPADSLNIAAQNAFLKTLEEPKPHCHFILLTLSPSALLPTILSRAQIFYPRVSNLLDQPPTAKQDVLGRAKRLLVAPAKDLPAIALEISKTKQPREQALLTVGATIELLYKSYFKTQNPKFLAKLPQFLALYEHLTQNCHIKLHLVADLL